MVIPTVEEDAPRYRVTSGVLPDSLRVDKTIGEISGIPTILGDSFDITIKVHEVGSEETTVTLVVKPLTILAIVLICVASVIMFCLMVLVVIRNLLI